MMFFSVFALRSALSSTHIVVIRVQLLGRVRLFVTPWTAAWQASLSFTISQSWLKLMSIESVMPSNHLILWRPLLLPSMLPTSGSFPVSQFFASGGHRIRASASDLYTSTLQTFNSPDARRKPYCSPRHRSEEPQILSHLCYLHSNTWVQKTGARLHIRWRGI